MYKKLILFLSIPMKTRQFIVISILLLGILMKLFDISYKLNTLERTRDLLGVMYEHTYSLKTNLAEINDLLHD